MVYSVEIQEKEDGIWYLLNDSVKAKYIDMKDNQIQFEIIYDENTLTELEANEMVKGFFENAIKEVLKESK